MFKSVMGHYDENDNDRQLGYKQIQGRCLQRMPKRLFFSSLNFLKSSSWTIVFIWLTLFMIKENALLNFSGTWTHILCSHYPNKPWRLTDTRSQKAVKGKSSKDCATASFNTLHPEQINHDIKKCLLD